MNGSIFPFHYRFLFRYPALFDSQPCCLDFFSHLGDGVAKPSSRFRRPFFLGGFGGVGSKNKVCLEGFGVFFWRFLEGFGFVFFFWKDKKGLPTEEFG